MKSKQFLWITLGVILCGIVMVAAPVNAATTETQTIYADKDTYVSSANPSSNYGSGSYFLAGYTGTTYYTAYFHFPYTATPANFQSAEIEIRYYSVSSAFYADVYYVTVDSWTEYGLTWNNQPYIYGGWNYIESDVYIYSSTTSLSFDVTDNVNDATGISICINSTLSATGYIQGYTVEASSYKPALIYTYLVSSFRIPGYDVVFLMLSSLGIVALIGYKYRNQRIE